jgi:hypothetical protein
MAITFNNVNLGGTFSYAQTSTYVPPTYPTWDTNSVTSTYGSFSNGNLSFTDTSASNSYKSAIGTKFSSTGKLYFECTWTGVSGTPYAPSTGIIATPGGQDIYMEQSSSPIGYAYGGYNGHFASFGVDLAFGSTYGTGAIIGIAVDIDAGKLWFALNGTWQASGNPAAGTNPAYNIATGTSYAFAAGNNASSSVMRVDANFGQAAWAYTPPAGFTGQTM